MSEIKKINGKTVKDETARNSITELQTQIDNIEVPTKTSDLTNDSDFATNANVDEKIANAQLGGGAITMFSMEIVNGDLIVNYPDESNNNVDFEINNYGELEVIINE